MGFCKNRGLLPWIVSILAVATIMAGAVRSYAVSGAIFQVLTSGAPSGPMITPLLADAGPPGGAPSTSVANYGPMLSGAAVNSWNATASNREMPSPVKGSISSLYVRFPTALLQGSYVVALSVNGSTSGAPSCTIDTTHAFCQDTSTIKNIAVNDALAWVVTPSGTPTAQGGTVQISAIFTSSVGNESPLFGGGAGSNMSNSATQYVSLNHTQAWNATENIASSIMPTAGTIDQMTVVLSTNPGAAASGKSYQFVVFQNGAAAPSGCTPGTNCLGCTVLEIATTCTDSTHSITVAATDTVSIEAIPTATPSVAIFKAAFRWRPTIAGEALALHGASAVPTTNSTRYANVSGTSASSATETDNLNISPVAMTYKKLYEAQSTAPGGATTRTVTLRVGTGSGQSNSSVTCTVASAATQCNDVNDSYASSPGDLTNLITTVSGTNAAITNFKTGMVVTVP